MDYSLYLYKNTKEKERRTYINLNSQGKVKGVETIKY